MYRILILFVISCSLCSCFKERIDIDYNTDDNKKMVVTGWISTNDEPQFVNVSRTVSYLGELAIDPVSGASVSLSDGTTVYDLTETVAGTYNLPADWTANIGADYLLKVVVDGNEYTASQRMRPCPEIENLSYRIADGFEAGGEETKIYETSFDFQERPGLGDAYYGVDYLKGSLAKDSLVNGSYIDDEFFDGELFTDVVLSEEERYFELGDTAMVDLYSIDVETSKYLQDIESEIYRGGPFDPPPANVRTNITGGAIGYFIISDSRRAQIVIE